MDHFNNDKAPPYKMSENGNKLNFITIIQDRGSDTEDRRCQQINKHRV